jgi:hypothetical protein
VDYEYAATGQVDPVIWGPPKNKIIKEGTWLKGSGNEQMGYLWIGANTNNVIRGISLIYDVFINTTYLLSDTLTLRLARFAVAMVRRRISNENYLLESISLLHGSYSSREGLDDI